MEATGQDPEKIDVNAIEYAPDGEITIAFKENCLFDNRPRQQRVTQHLEKDGYIVKPGPAVGSTAYRTVVRRH
jgi:hypothetical protein